MRVRVQVLVRVRVRVDGVRAPEVGGLASST